MDNETLQIEECRGDIFRSPANSLLINIVDYGDDWATSISRQFRMRYLHAYRQYCMNHRRYDNEVIGTAHLSLPTSMYGEGNETMEPNKNKLQDYHFIGTLTIMKNNSKCTPDIPLGCTASAIIQLLKKIDNWNEISNDKYKIKDIIVCRVALSSDPGYLKLVKEMLQFIDVSNYGTKKVKIITL